MLFPPRCVFYRSDCAGTPSLRWAHSSALSGLGAPGMHPCPCKIETPVGQLHLGRAGPHVVSREGSAAEISLPAAVSTLHHFLCFWPWLGGCCMKKH